MLTITFLCINFLFTKEHTFKFMNLLIKIFILCCDPCVHASLRVSGKCPHIYSLCGGDFKVRTAPKAEIPQCNATTVVILAC